MAISALSTNSMSTNPIQVAQQVKSDLQSSTSQGTQSAQKPAQAPQTDTVTLSAQALKAAEDKNAVAQKTADKTTEQQTSHQAGNNAAVAQNATQRVAAESFGAVSKLGL